MSQGKRVLIVGGVAGGASCAARLRRLCERSDIILFDKGPHVSFANCGLPYYVGDVIRDEKKLLVASPDLFQYRFNIVVRTENEVLRIDRAARRIAVREVRTGRVYEEPYDALVLSPGAAPVRPPIPGIASPGIFALRTIPDSRRIRDWIVERATASAVVVGGGFIGLEMAENLARRGLAVTIVEAAPQVMPPLDPEMAHYVHERLEQEGVSLRLGDGVAAFEPSGAGLVVRTQGGAAYETGLAILAIGVRPETTLAREAGLELGARGGIRVDDAMRTSDPAIWAVGDAVETRDVVTGEWGLIPLAGVANRQGRIAAESICGRERRFRGVQGTAVCGVFGLAVAATGANERTLRRLGKTAYAAVYLHPGHHAGYYPGAKPIHLKLIFERPGGRILGAQAVGEEGAERRIDVIAMAMQRGATVFDLEEAELCYAPQYGAAKDPVNVAGMVASNVLRGDVELADWAALEETDALLVDVREPVEFAAGAIPGAVNVSLNELRGRVDELPRDREIWLNCGVGQRAYYASRLLAQHGFRVKNLSGGYQTWKALRPREE